MSCPFWGEPDGNIRFLEPSYVVSPYIAEFWNTISNLGFFLLPLLYWKTSISHLLLYSILMIGTGSLLFHGTARHVAEIVDEAAMIFFLTLLLYPTWGHLIPLMNVSLYVFYMIRSSFVAFFLLFLLNMVLLIHSFPRAWHALGWFLLGSLCWMCGQYLSFPTFYFFHALWHVCTTLAISHLCTYIIRRDHVHKKNGKICTKYGETSL